MLADTAPLVGASERKQAASRHDVAGAERHHPGSDDLGRRHHMQASCRGGFPGPRAPLRQRLRLLLASAERCMVHGAWRMPASEMSYRTKMKHAKKPSDPVMRKKLKDTMNM